MFCFAFFPMLCPRRDSNPQALCAPPPQDSVYANSTTWTKSIESFQTGLLGTLRGSRTRCTPPTGDDVFSFTWLPPCHWDYYTGFEPTSRMACLPSISRNTDSIVPKAGVEPARPKALVPKTSVSTIPPLRQIIKVGVTGLEPATSASQMPRATNCATPRLGV